MIACEQHDYIEIACTYRLALELSLRDGSRVRGTAIDTGYDGQRHECLKLQTENQEQWVILTDIAELRALSPNPHFDRIVIDLEAGSA